MASIPANCGICDINKCKHKWMQRSTKETVDLHVISKRSQSIFQNDWLGKADRRWGQSSWFGIGGGGGSMVPLDNSVRKMVDLGIEYSEKKDSTPIKQYNWTLIMYNVTTVQRRGKCNFKITNPPNERWYQLTSLVGNGKNYRSLPVGQYWHEPDSRFSITSS